MSHCNKCNKPQMTKSYMNEIIRQIMSIDDPIWKINGVDTRDINVSMKRILLHIKREFLMKNTTDKDVVHVLSGWDKDETVIPPNVASYIFRFLYRFGDGYINHFKFYRWINKGNDPLFLKNVDVFLDYMHLCDEEITPFPKILYSLRKYGIIEKINTIDEKELGCIYILDSTVSFSIHDDVERLHGRNGEDTVKLIFNMPDTLPGSSYIDMRDPQNDRLKSTLIKDEGEIILRRGVKFQITKIMRNMVNENGKTTHLYANVTNDNYHSSDMKKIHMGVSTWNDGFQI